MKREFIIEYEERLRQAMLNGDIKALEELIDDNLIFCKSLRTNLNEGSGY